MARFIQYDRHQQYLLPPSVDEWLAERLAPNVLAPDTNDPVVKMAHTLKTQ